MPSIATTGGGTCTAAPDPCKTPAPPGPPVVMPYSNQSMCMMANAGTATKKVKVFGKPVITQMTIIPQSMQNEAGVAGGVVSGVNMGPTRPQMASLFVKAEGAGVVYQSCAMGQNGMAPNAVGVQDTPSQPFVQVTG
ncbi:MAG: PAAR-like domain-containing protein [Polyangiaceae bacterium]